MADDVNALAVAAVLQYFVVLVVCRMLLITRKSVVENTVKPWLTTRTVLTSWRLSLTV